MAAPTQLELACVWKLRENIQDIAHELLDFEKTDMKLLTWLRARELNLSQAEEMLRQFIVWLKKSDFRNAQNWVPPENFDVQKTLPYQLLGFTQDDSRCPVLLGVAGIWDVKTLLESEGGCELFQRTAALAISQTYQQLIEQSEPPNDVVTQAVVIGDLEGFSFRQLASKKVIMQFIELLKMGEANFPEVLKKGYVINAPRIFSTFFSILKPFLTARTLSKVEIHSSNSLKWKTSLAKILSPEQLPLKYGGCKRLSFLSTSNNHKYEESTGDSSSLTTLTVPAGKRVTLDFEVTKPGSIMTWAFSVQEHDVGFAVLLDGVTEAHNYSRVPVHEGYFLCENTGKYMVVFDNSFSRFRSKTVFYSVQIVSPETVEYEDEELTSGNPSIGPNSVKG